MKSSLSKFLCNQERLAGESVFSKFLKSYYRLPDKADILIKLEVDDEVHIACGPADEVSQ